MSLHDPEPTVETEAREQDDRPSARRFARDVLVAVVALAVVAVVGQGLAVWRLAVLAVVLLAIVFRPRRDPVAKHERYIERGSDAFARTFLDTVEMTERGVQKIMRDPRFAAAKPAPLEGPTLDLPPRQ